MNKNLCKTLLLTATLSFTGISQAANVTFSVKDSTEAKNCGLSKVKFDLIKLNQFPLKHFTLSVGERKNINIGDNEFYLNGYSITPSERRQFGPSRVKAPSIIEIKMVDINIGSNTIHCVPSYTVK